MTDRSKEEEGREVFSIIIDISKALRMCRHDEAFCGGVSFTQFIILDAVSENKALTMKKLGDILSVDKSTVTRLVRPLIEKNLIVMGKDDSDSRKVILNLSEEGTRAYEDIMQCFLLFSRAVQSELPEESKVRSMEGARLFLNALQSASAARDRIKKFRGRVCGNCC